MIMNVPTQEEIKQIKNDLSDFKFRVNPTTGKPEKSIDGGVTWENFSNGGEAVLLWTNSSPTSAFAAQTISLSLSNYDYVLVEYKNTSSATVYATVLIDKSISTSQLTVSNTSGSSGSYRTVTVSNSGVVFGGGYSGGSANNNVCIPTRIWGCKAMEMPLKEPFKFALGSFTAEVNKKYKVYFVAATDDTYPNYFVRSVSGMEWIETPNKLLDGRIYYNTHNVLLTGVLKATSTTVTIKTGRGTDNNIIIYSETD